MWIQSPASDLGLSVPSFVRYPSVATLNFSSCHNPMRSILNKLSPNSEPRGAFWEKSMITLALLLPA